MRRIILCALLLAAAASNPADVGAAPTEKVGICHVNADLDPDAPTWERLEIRAGVKNVAAHRGHGDAFPGDPVPGTEGAYVFDDACVPVPVAVADVCVYRDQLRSEGIAVDRPAEFTLRLGAELTTDVTDDQNGKLVVGPIQIPYSGSEVLLRVSDDRDPTRSDSLYFEGIRSFGEDLTVVAAAAGLPEFTSDTWVHLLTTVDPSPIQSIGFHTSCSSPILINAQMGTVSVVGAVFVDANSGRRYAIP